jgi:hypothetical protein
MQSIRTLNIDKTNGLQFSNHIIERVSNLATTQTVRGQPLSVVIGQYKLALREGNYDKLLSEQPCAKDQLYCTATLNSYCWDHTRVVRVQYGDPWFGTIYCSVAYECSS